MKKNEMNNKGFSLVELIIVIAIMVILAVALAPVFTKQLERSRVASDVNTASTLAECITVALTEGKINVPASTPTATTLLDSSNCGASKTFDSITAAPVAKTKVVTDGKFYYLITASGEVQIFVNTSTAATADNMVYPTVGSTFSSYTN